MHAPPRLTLRTLLRDSPDAIEANCRPDALLVEAGVSAPARLAALHGQGPLLLLRLQQLGDGGEELLAKVLPVVDGIVLGGRPDIGDIVRLGTRLGVSEALADRPDGAVFVIAEVGPAALLEPLSLGAAGPRLRGLLWHDADLARACGARPEAFSQGNAGAVVRTLLSLAAAALGLPAYDTASPDPVLRQDAEAARQMGLSGKVAAHPGQVPVIRSAFEMPQPM